MAWLALDPEGQEVILETTEVDGLPFRSDGYWRTEYLDDPKIELPKGSIKKLTGKEITNPNIIIDLDDMEEIDMGDEKEPEEIDLSYPGVLVFDGVDKYCKEKGVLLKDYTAITPRVNFDESPKLDVDDKVLPTYSFTAGDILKEQK